MSEIERGNRDYFFCYNKRVSDYLRDKGLKYITIAKDMNTDSVFSMYEITPQFQKAMDQYKQDKHNRMKMENK